MRTTKRTPTRTRAIALTGVLLVAMVWLHTGAGETERNGREPEGMLLIPGGEFEMGISESDLGQLVEMGHDVPHMSLRHAMWWFGDEIPRHAVKVEPFYLDAHEVTNRQFAEFVRQTGYQAQGKWKKAAKKRRLDHPVVNVTWNDAAAYAEWAGKRLPTEAEWEFAARGGRNVRWFPWGDDPDPAGANYRHQGESFGAGLVRVMGMRKLKTTPVGSYEPNGYGLHDMVGNVSEWCEDDYAPYPGGPHEGGTYTRYGEFREGAQPEHKKVYRSGSWNSPNPVFVRITHRSGAPPASIHRGLGFRCARSIESEGGEH